MDLTARKMQNLASLKLTNNQVADLAPLRELTSLQSLDLANNPGRRPRAAQGFDQAPVHRDVEQPDRKARRP